MVRQFTLMEGSCTRDDGEKAGWQLNGICEATRSQASVGFPRLRIAGVGFHAGEEFAQDSGIFFRAGSTFLEPLGREAEGA